MIHEGPHGKMPYETVVVGATEATGPAPLGHVDGIQTDDPSGRDRLCAASFTAYHTGSGFWIPVRSFSFLCNPGRLIPETAAMQTGFHWSGYGIPAPKDRIDLAGLPPFRKFAQAMLAFFDGAALAFHGAQSDVAIIDAELHRMGLPLLQGPLFCSRKAFSDMRGHGRVHDGSRETGLDALCDTLRVARHARTGNDGMPRHGAELTSSLAASCMIEMEHLGWMHQEGIRLLPHRKELLAFG